MMHLYLLLPYPTLQLRNETTTTPTLSSFSELRFPSYLRHPGISLRTIEFPGWFKQSRIIKRSQCYEAKMVLCLLLQAVSTPHRTIRSHCPTHLISTYRTPTLTAELPVRT